MCVVQCSPNHSMDERTRSCHPCGSECKSLARDKNRSVVYPNDKGLQFVLQDPEKSGVSIVAVAVVSVSIVVFLVMFGVLQFRSKNKMRYFKVNAEPFSSKDEDDGNLSFTDGEEDRAHLLQDEVSFN